MGFVQKSGFFAISAQFTGCFPKIIVLRFLFTNFGVFPYLSAFQELENLKNVFFRRDIVKKLALFGLSGQYTGFSTKSIVLQGFYNFQSVTPVCGNFSGLSSKN